MENENKKVKKGIPPGRLCFLGGIILAIASGFFEIPHLAVILLLLGLLVGILNVQEKETNAFLTAVVALTVVGIGGLQAFTTVEFAGMNAGGITELFTSILQNFTAFVAAAGFIVALRQVFVSVKPTDTVGIGGSEEEPTSTEE